MVLDCVRSVLQMLCAVGEQQADKSCAVRQVPVLQNYHDFCKRVAPPYSQAEHLHYC